MRETTLGYIKRGEEYLLLFRNKKKNDENGGKWVGIGGMREPGESMDECFVREMREETGLTPARYEQIALIHFISDEWGAEDMYLYIAEIGEEDGMSLPDCDEGELHFIKSENMLQLPMWQGDRCFLEKMLAGEKDFEMTLRYAGENLAECILHR